MDGKPTPPPETTPSWVAGFRRRIPFYIILAVLLAALAGILTFFFLNKSHLRISAFIHLESKLNGL